MKKGRMSKVSMLVTFVFLLTLFAGANLGIAQDKIQITQWVFPLAGEERDMKFFRPVVEEFQKEHANIKVSIEHFPWEGRAERYMLSVAGGRAPDIGYLNADNFAQFADMGALVPLEGYISEQLWDDFKTGAKQLLNWKGHFYVMPILATSSPPWYHMDLLNEAGIGEFPTTWKEYEELCRKTTKDLDGDGKPDQWGTTHGLIPFGPWFLWLPWFYQAGGEWMNAEMTEATFNNESGVEALEFIVKLYDNYMSPMDISKGQHYNELFLTGKAASLWAEEQAFIKVVTTEYPDLNFRLGPVLKYKDQVTMGTVGGYGIFSQSKYPDAAAEWLLFFTNDQNQLDFLEYFYFISPRTSLDNSLKASITDPNFHVAVDASKYARDMMTHPASAHFMKEILVAIQEAVLHEKMAKDALDDAAKKMSTILETMF